MLDIGLLHSAAQIVPSMEGICPPDAPVKSFILRCPSLVNYDICLVSLSYRLHPSYGKGWRPLYSKYVAIRTFIKYDCFGKKDFNDAKWRHAIFQSNLNYFLQEFVFLSILFIRTSATHE